MRKLLRFTTGLVAILTLFIIASPSYAGLDDKSLVLYLSFDEGKGATAKDSSAYGHDGELIKNPIGLMDNLVARHLSLMAQKGNMLWSLSTIPCS